MQCLRGFEVSPDSRFVVRPSHTGLIKTLLTTPKVEKAFCFLCPLVVAVNHFLASNSRTRNIRYKGFLCPRSLLAKFPLLHLDCLTIVKHFPSLKSFAYSVCNFLFLLHLFMDIF